MNFFLVVGLIGFVLMMFSMFSGHDADLSVDHDVGHIDGSDHDSISVFSFRTIMTFLTAFGGVGWLCMYLGKTMLFASFCGITCGLIFGFVAWWLTNFAMKQQVNSLIGSDSFLNRSAIVHTTIPENGIGEVQIEFAGQRKYLSARAKDGHLIPANTTVTVIENIAGTLVVEIKQ